MTKESQPAGRKSPARKRRPSPGRVALTLCMSFLLMWLLLAFAAVAAVSTTVESPSYMQSRVPASGFGQTVYDTVSASYASRAAGAGFDSGLLAQAISPEQIELDMQERMLGLFGEDNGDRDYTALQANIYGLMYEEAGRLGAATTPELEESLQYVAEACRQDYKNYVSLPFADKLQSVFARLDGYLTPAMFAAGAACLVFAGILFLLGGRRISFLRYLAFALTAAALVCLVISLTVYPALGLERLNLNPPSLKNLLLAMVEGVFRRFGLIAACYFILSVDCAALSLMGKKRSSRKSSNGHSGEKKSRKSGELESFPSQE